MTAVADLPVPARPSPTVGPRLLRAVRTDPPYEDELADTTEAGVLVPLALTLRRAVGAEVDLPEFAAATAEAADPGAVRAVEADLRRLFGRQRTPRAQLPAPGPRAAAAVRLLLEVLTGDRPTRQVAGWVSPRVLAGLEDRSPDQHRTLPRRPVLHSLRVTEPADGIAEVSAVVICGDRHRAVALRLDGVDGRWMVTALHVG